jgi:hypothetical protein
MAPRQPLRGTGSASGASLAENGLLRKVRGCPPRHGEGDRREAVVEGCHPIENGTPLRQAFGLPPPLAGEEFTSAP